MPAHKENMKTKTTSWLAPAMSTQSQISETDVMLQTFMAGGEHTAEAHTTTTTGSSTLTGPMELDDVVVNNSTEYKTFQQEPGHHTANNISLDQEESREQQENQDWSIPVSKFLQGFRVQAAASLSNAYRYVFFLCCFLLFHFA